ncbi:MAG TPA: c-type cytochrome [Gemmatimonadaceae bacterium]
MRPHGSRSARRGLPTGAIALAAVILILAVISRRAISSPGGRDVVVAALALDAPASDSLSELIARGRRVFEGKAGGALCVACHGPQAKGVPGIGPDLTDGAWLHGDGSLASIRTIIRAGVAAPKKTAAVMPPFGGAPLQPDQLEAVATYVHSLSAAGR